MTSVILVTLVPMSPSMFSFGISFLDFSISLFPKDLWEQLGVVLLIQSTVCFFGIKTWIDVRNFNHLIAIRNLSDAIE